MRKLTLLIVSIFFIFSSIYGQEKRSLTMGDIENWERLSDTKLSSDGTLIAVKHQSWKGSTTLKLYSSSGKLLHSANSVTTFAFLPNSNKLLYRTRAKAKRYNVTIYNAEERNEEVYKGVVRDTLVRTPNTALLLFKRDSLLEVVSESGVQLLSSAKVYDFTRSGNRRVVITAQEGAIVRYNLQTSAVDTIWCSQKEVEKMRTNYSGNRVAFVQDGALFLQSANNRAKEISSRVNIAAPLNFSIDGLKLYFSVPIDQKYSGQEKMRGKLHIWSWKEKSSFTEQMVQIEEGKIPYYPTVYNIKTDKVFRITEDSSATLRYIGRGNSPLVAVISDTLYRTEKMWENRSLYDLVMVDTQQERVVDRVDGVMATPQLSPKGGYLYWYSAPDSTWMIYSVENRKVTAVTPPSLIKVFNHLDDRPAPSPSYGTPGWSSDDSAFYVYDQYDMWEIDPTGASAPKNLTKNGKNINVTYRYIPYIKRKIVDFEKSSLLHGFNNKTKGSALYKIEAPNHTPQFLIGGEYMIDNVIKASRADSWTFTKESYNEFPNIHYSSNLFKKTNQITNANPQQSEFLWGSAELVNWNSKDGKKVEGLLFKPENWDPNKRYPVIVYFYEKHSHTLFSHRTPKPHRYMIDYHQYNSDGYVVFTPDVHYTTGHPGMSAYNCVIPGVEMLIEQGIADPARIGAQGHSWGGYQVAYLATKSSLFAAIESGTPVVNMFSAYGGIRWGSGRSRAYQYEYGQSRIGKSPWEAPELYFENSPLFSLDKVTTPMLILHNDEDGHVPWEQGIECFIALKRLRKPAWLLNYTGEIHWPRPHYKKVDFQIRMKQFFDHFLKGAAAPEWMYPGYSAIELGVTK